jgi:hypothetical protein
MEKEFRFYEQLPSKELLALAHSIKAQIEEHVDVEIVHHVSKRFLFCFFLSFFLGGELFHVRRERRGEYAGHVKCGFLLPCEKGAFPRERKCKNFQTI